jgi:uncharacterized membrane protein (Fun14 family)
VDKGRRKRIADMAEKLGIGLVLGVLVQGAFAKEISYRVYVVGAFIVTLGIVLLITSIILSRED